MSLQESSNINKVGKSDENTEEIGWSLVDCPIMMSLYPVDDQGTTESAVNSKTKPVLGRLEYYAPIQTADGVINEKRPTITAWVGIGRANFELLRNQLLTTDVLDFDLGIEVEFPRGAVETGWFDKTVRWDGRGSLPVISATFAWKRGDWDSDTEQEFNARSSAAANLAMEELPREQVELLQAVKRLEATVAKLMTPLWLIVGAVIIAALLAR